MESIYRSYDANASDKLNINKYFAEYSNRINYKFNGNSENDFSNTIDIPLPPEQLAELAKNCSVNLLNNEGISVSIDKRRSTATKQVVEIPNDVDLQTLIQLKKKYSESSLKLYRSSLKYQSEQIVNYTEPITTDPKAQPGKDILIFIRVYHPFYCKPGDSYPKRRKITLAHVIAILGQQTLADLRDTIQCLSDLSVTTESSENPWQFVEVANKDIYKSCFFYIESSFYNDMRDENNEDNSLPIREWAKTRKLGPFHTAKMEDTRIDSLDVRFGYPWVFQHQGECEHLIVFSDARLVASDDDLAIANYPRISRAKPVKYPSCTMCMDRSAQWIIFDSPRIPHEPSFHCQQCFWAFNYVKGKKVGNFKAYRYPYDPELMKLINTKK